MRVNLSTIVFFLMAICTWSVLALLGSRYSCYVVKERAEKLRATFVIGSWLLLGIALVLYMTISPELAGKFSALVAAAALLAGCYGSKSSRDLKIDSALSVSEELFATKFIYLGLEVGVGSVGIWTIVLLRGSHSNVDTSSFSAPVWLWFLYGLAVIMAWVENHAIGRSEFERPGLLRGGPQFVFAAIRLAVTYGTLVALWRISGLTSTLIAFGVYFIFQSLTIRLFYNKELRRQVDLFMSREKEKVQDRNLPFEESGRLDEAMKYARFTVMKNLES